MTAIAGSSSWSIDTAASRVDLMIDLTGTDLLPGDEIALHWGFNCANNVIEDAYSVPKPGILAMLSIGLFGYISASTPGKQRISI